MTLTFTVTVEGEVYAVSGRLTCFGAGLPLPGIPMIEEGTDFCDGLPVSLATVTDADGYYSFAELIRGDYTITQLPEDDPGPAGLSAEDATNIARASVGAYDLDAFQQRVADVTGNGDISGLDAARLLQYANGLRPAMSDDPDALRRMSDPPAAGCDFGGLHPGRCGIRAGGQHRESGASLSGNLLSLPGDFCRKRPGSVP